MSTNKKSYNKLRPFTEIESCKCDSIEGILLVDMFTDNPIHCIKCKNEIDPEYLKLPGETVDAVYHWKSVFSSLYLLWLDSNEYESWAKTRLLDNKGEVNQLGLDAIELLSKNIPAYLWWFWDSDDGNPSSCPNCGVPLNTVTDISTGKCERCKIYI